MDFAIKNHSEAIGSGGVSLYPLSPLRLPLSSPPPPSHHCLSLKGGYFVFLERSVGVAVRALRVLSLPPYANGAMSIGSPLLRSFFYRTSCSLSSPPSSFSSSFSSSPFDSSFFSSIFCLNETSFLDGLVSSSLGSR